jgi:DNA-binding NtrC family response regulator
MNDSITVLWIGNRHGSAEFSALLKTSGYSLITAPDLRTGLESLRKDQIGLIVLENEISCVQGELAAVRLKSAAPRVPILLLCEPLDSAAPQAFFVNLILGLKAAPELVLRAVKSLLPQPSPTATGT